MFFSLLYFSFREEEDASAEIIILILFYFALFDHVTIALAFSDK